MTVDRKTAMMIIKLGAVIAIAGVVFAVGSNLLGLAKDWAVLIALGVVATTGPVAGMVIGMRVIDDRWREWADRQIGAEVLRAARIEREREAAGG